MINPYLWYPAVGKKNILVINSNNESFWKKEADELNIPMLRKSRLLTMIRIFIREENGQYLPAIKSPHKK